MTGVTFNQFLLGKKDKHNHFFEPIIQDWIDHLSTLFPQIRLKQYLEVRSMDDCSWNEMVNKCETLNSQEALVIAQNEEKYNNFANVVISPEGLDINYDWKPLGNSSGVATNGTHINTDGSVVTTSYNPEECTTLDKDEFNGHLGPYDDTATAN